MNAQDCEQLTLFPADSPASPFLSPGSAEARRTTVTSGQKCCELSRSSGPLGSLVRTLLVSSAWRSTRCLLTCKVSATPARRLLYRLVPSTPRTGETGARLWPAATAANSYTGRLKSTQQKPWSMHSVNLTDAVRMWPTPSASDCGRTAINPHLTKNGTIRHIGKNGAQSYARLDAVVAMFPTPKARDAKDTTRLPPSRLADPGKDSLVQRVGREIQKENGGQLNPTWVEWLMGFPVGWTDLDA